MTHIKHIVIALTIAAGGAGAQGQDQAGDDQGGFDAAATQVQQRLEESIAELNQLREQLAAEKIPLSRELSSLEAELTAVRREYQEASRILATRSLDLTRVRGDIDKLQEDISYLSNLLGEYTRNFETRLHISERQRYEALIGEAKFAPENSRLTHQQIYEAQLAVVQSSLERLEDVAGGERFEGSAVGADGLLQRGEFVLLGPAAVFRSSDGAHVGTITERIDSQQPSIVAFENLQHQQAADALVSGSGDSFLLDPTLGNAHVIEATKETLVEHIRKGGVVMIPIFVLAGLAFLVALYKWLTLSLVRNPSRRKIDALLRAVARRNREDAERAAKAISGPAGRMLETGVEHIDEPRELIEEVMFEKVLATRLKLQRMLPFIAISAAAAPLLGLLGTVTGIINTFRLITVFGTGDVKMLSGGISEALITTEFGLIVAIPSLLLHAFLSRKAKGVIDRMEKAAVALANQIAKTWHASAPHAAGKQAVAVTADAESTLAAVASGRSDTEIRQLLRDVLSPLVKDTVERAERKGTPGPAREPNGAATERREKEPKPSPTPV